MRILLNLNFLILKDQQKTSKEAWVREKGSINTVQAEAGISRASKETMVKFFQY